MSETTTATTWWHARAWMRDIEPVEVIRQTERYVIVANERRRAIETDDDAYFPTWEAAHQWLLNTMGHRLELARCELAKAQGAYGNVKGMKKPAEAADAE
jgi:hypothetical protein